MKITNRARSSSKFEHPILIFLSSRIKPGAYIGLLTILLVGLHVLAGFRVGLSADAAHYALYGYFPALSYFDHPPMIGWMQMLVEKFSTSNLALRLWPVVLMGISTLLLYRLGRRLFPELSPWFSVTAVVVMQSAIMIQLMGITMLPDDPLLVFYLLAGSALYDTLVLDRPKTWLIVGLWFGLAALSKYTAVALLGTTIILFITEHRWKQLRMRWPWLGALLALLLISPILIWNMRHEWVSFQYQIFHLDNHGARWSWLRFARSQAIQFFSYSPGIYLLGWVSIAWGFRFFKDARIRFLLAWILPVFLLIDGASGKELALPHWTAVGWVATSLLIARWLWIFWERRWVRWSAYASAVYSLLAVGLIVSELVFPWIPFPRNKNPFQDLYGWNQAAHQAALYRSRMIKTSRLTTTTLPVIFAGNWSYASHLAWYGRPVPVQLISDAHLHQIDLWYGHPHAGEDGVLVIPWLFRHQAARWVAHFNVCHALRDLPIYLHKGQEPVTTYYFYACWGYHSA